MKVAGRLRSCLGPLKLTHHGVLWSLRWRKPQKLHWSPFEWTSKSLLWYRFRCVAWKSRQPSFTALSSREIFIFLWIRLSFIHKTHALSSFFFPVVTNKSLGVFVCRDSAGFHWIFHLQVLHVDQKASGKCQIRPAEVFQFVNYYTF